ncbi:MAG: prolyl oligopeptidase family serine peptidase [Microscillaceae bacterium]|nr:prolyl oligopeptidase family serine peptidase [Microscillaceae bacterium]
MKKYWVLGSLSVFLILLAAYVGVGYVMHQKLSHIQGRCDNFLHIKPDNFGDETGFWKNKDFDPTQYRMKQYESVKFPSREEGIEIAGFFVSGQQDAPAVIVVHGLGSCKHKTTEMVPAGILNKAGFNVLMIDVRDAGESTLEDGLSAIGNEEYLDALGAWDWLQKEKKIPAHKIGMMGNSMGAATTLIAFSQEPKLAAVFVDAPFDNLTQITSEELKREGYPQFLFYAGWAAGLLQGDNLLAFNPHEAIDKAGKRPLFIIHSTGDTRIGVHHSYQLREKAQKAGVNATFWIVEGIEHVQTAGAFPEEYEQKIVGFFKKVLR